MTVFADTWNATYEGLPSDNENISLGANRIRDLKVNTRERIAVDHSFAGDANDGLHLHSQYLPQGADPPAAPPLGVVYTKTVGTGVTELFYEDSSGDVLQLTSSGTINAQAFPSGTSMLFVQTVPPAGWVQRTDVNDLLLRMVNDSSGGTGGGSWTITGTNVSTSTATGTSTSTSTVLNSLGLSTSIGSVNMSLSMNAISLSAANLPPHQHNVTATFNTAGTGSPTGANTNYSNTVLQTDGGIGLGGTAFTPSGTVSFVSGSATTGVTSSSLSSTSSSSSTSTSTSAFSNDGTWRPGYINVLRATKS